MGDVTSDLAQRPLRARRSDAQHNHARLLEAAASVFAERGADASLDEVARSAGVGSGTLYRHFASRDALILELMRESLEELEQLATNLAATKASADAAMEWLTSYVGHASRFQGLAATLVMPDVPDDDPSAVACHRARAAGQALVAEAIATGPHDRGIDPQDLLDLAAAVAWITENGARGSDQPERLLRLITAGLIRVQ